MLSNWRKLRQFPEQCPPTRLKMLDPSSRVVGATSTLILTKHVVQSLTYHLAQSGSQRQSSCRAFISDAEGGSSTPSVADASSGNRFAPSPWPTVMLHCSRKRPEVGGDELSASGRMMVLGDPISVGPESP